MHSTPSRRATATGALIAAAAILAASVQSGAAAADAPRSIAPKSQHGSSANPGKLPADLTPSARAELIKAADADKTSTGRSLGLGTQEDLVVRDVAQDRDGTTHTRYERTYAGLPVLGGDLIVETSKAGARQNITKASAAELKNLDTNATVTPAAAEQQALGLARAAGSDKAASDRAPRKVVWMGKGAPVLAYESVVGGLQHDGTPNELHVVTDARTGTKLYQWQGVENGTGNTMYSGQVTLGTAGSASSYTLTDTGRGSHKTYNLNGGNSGKGTLFSNTTDVWGNGTPQNKETAGADAHYGAALTWDYYKNVQGRTGIRGDGVGAYTRVHYGSAYQNAFWDDGCFCMTYGDGAGNTKPLTSIDIAAHEMTHGVTANTAGLQYSDESGGLNEATSDIMAAAVEFWANNAQDKGDYLVGEKIDLFGTGKPLRYMDKPSKDGSSKDAWYSGLGNLDVHYSSGPANHFFYLLSEGSGAKTINGVDYNSPTSDGLPVTGIGRDKATLIWYKALTTKFGTTTDYAGARTGTVAVAKALYGDTSPEVAAVENSWAAINVGPRSGGDTPPTGKVFENTADVSIPDNGAAVTSTVNVTGITGNAPTNLSVSVDISHTFRGDLVVDLVAPDGSVYNLKPFSSSDSADNVKATYTVNASSEVANGTWKLRVQDKASQDTGYINSFKLTFP
ncbi:M4 family metallopeptidase [Streptomyces sp. NPDC051555]|uniref:M4 family metallopeptidase n=1 Tax=Streptomyces sp. NPDC051555 TaxID=3365657 RepID=UPI0037950BF2